MHIEVETERGSLNHRLPEEERNKLYLLILQKYNSPTYVANLREIYFSQIFFIEVKL